MPISFLQLLKPDEEERRRKIEAAKQRMLQIKQQLQRRIEPAVRQAGIGVGEFVSRRVEPIAKRIPTRERIVKRVKPILREQYKPRKLLEDITGVSAVKTGLKAFVYDPQKKRVLPASPYWDVTDPYYKKTTRDIAMGKKWKDVPEEDRKRVLQNMMSTVIAAHTPTVDVPGTPATRAYATYWKGLKKYKIPRAAKPEQVGNAFEKAMLKAEGNPKAVKTVLKDFRILERIKPEEAIKDITGITQWFRDLITPRKALPKPPVKAPVVPPKAIAPPKPKLPPPTKEKVIRLADKVNKKTFAVRGGTWTMTPDSDVSLVTETKGVIGGKNRYTGTVKLKSSLVIKDAELETGSFAVVNEGYENYLPRKHKEAANSLWEKLHVKEEIPPGEDVDKIIMDSLFDAGVPEATAQKVITLAESNKFDAAMDLIVSRGLKEVGYDSLILERGKDRHIFVLDKKRLSFEPVKKPLPALAKPEAPIAVEEFVPQEKPKVTTVKQLEKRQRAEKLRTYLDKTKTQEELVSRVKTLTKQLDKPKLAVRHPVLKEARVSAIKKIEELTGVKGLGRNWKQDYGLLQMAKQDPDIADSVEALENYVGRLDEITGAKTVRKAYEMAMDEGLPTKGEFFIPYGRYSTKGTRNLEWVRENIPLLHMGNKRGMMGYILDGLGVKQKDLGLLATEDASHLKGFNQVHDLFGGSGLLSSVSKKLFPGAKITYNELGKGTLEAIEKSKKDPKTIQKIISEVAVWLNKNPGADWLSHFSTVYKDSPDFLTAARLIEASAGRGEMTQRKLQNVIKAIPNFAKTFKGIKTTSEDALKRMNKLAKTGTSKDFLWLDPPYLWSAGYGVGAEMEKAAGFVKLLNKLDKLNKRGVKFMFFNNDPEVQVEKAGGESVHLKNIMGKINQLSENMTVVRGIRPIGAAKRREILITNTDFGKTTGRLLNLSETQKAIEALKDDPATAPREVLKMFRELRGTTELVPQAEKITAHQIRTIRTLRSRLRIKNRELLPVMDELLDDHSFAKMTREDGKRMISWLQPRNWEVIEDHIARTRKELFEGRKDRLIGEKLVAKDSELENKFGVINALNKTTEEMQNITEMVNSLPPLEKDTAGGFKSLLKWTSPYLSEDLGAKLVGIKGGFHTPMRAIINTSKKHTNRMKKSLVKVFKDLSKAERKQVIMIQAGAPSAIKKAASEKVQRTAKYMQDVAEKNIEVVNRLRAAINKPPLKSRKPYIPYIIDENISQAADLFDKNKFWEQRTKTFKEFQAGLFTHDPARIIDIWSESSGNWLKKNLFSALLLDRYQNLYNVGGPAAAYGRTIVELDIYNMLPTREKLFRSLGTGINESIGSIFPKKIPIEPELARAIENTTFGKDLMADVSKGYLKIPRVQLPNVGDVFHKVFYPAKLAWNFSFAILNRTQPLAGIPFEGMTAKLASRAKMYSMIFPWNWNHAQRYIKILEESGYQYGRHVAGQELKPIKGKIGQAVDRTVNFVGDITELENRLENALGAEKFISQAEGRMKEKLSQADKDKIMGTYSAFINFLSGKGYAPPAQRSMAGRFAYTFQQYPINQLNVYSEMYKIAMKDDGVREFWKMMAREGGASQESVKFFDKLPNGSKARIFLVFLALALPIATIYALSRSWNTASRALPGLPRIAFSDLASSVSDFIEDPEKNKDALVNSVKQFFSVTAKKRLDDALNVYETGILQRGYSKKPIFADQSADSIAKLFVFGRSTLPEYERQYPQLLGKFFGKQTEAGRVKEFQKERGEIRTEETETAVEFMRSYIKAKTPEEKRTLFKEYAEGGRFTEGVIKKLKKFYKEQATGVGGLERSIVSLQDEDQARFVLEEFNKTKDVDEKKELMKRYYQQGILTKNVIAEMKRLAQEDKPGFFSL